MKSSEMPCDPSWSWAVYRPNEQLPWDLIRAGHLYRRAGFGASWDQLQAALATSPEKTIERLIVPGNNMGSFNRTHDDYEKSASDSEDSLRGWWLRRMLETPHTLLEKLTLFWHNHFAVSSVRVDNLKLMAEHVRTLRKHALGDYRELLLAVMQDPATFLTLEASQNRKNALTTSVARQLLEQYTLGPELTSETDVREAARAFTGWFVRDNQLRFVEREHDNGAKVFLGRSGNWAKRDILDIVLEHPAVPRLIVHKLYRWFISESDTVPDSLVTPLAESFGRDFDIAKLVQTMLRSNLFFSEQAYRRRIKSPVEYVLGIVLAMRGKLPTITLGQDINHLGQELYNPPTRTGWAGGKRWLSPPMLIGRANLAADMLSTVGRYGGKLDPLLAVTKSGDHKERLLDILLQGDLDQSALNSLHHHSGGATLPESQHLRRMAHGVFCLPEFQLA